MMFLNFSRIAFLICLYIFLIPDVNAQESANEYVDLWKRNKKGMEMLTSWAALNIGSSLLLANKSNEAGYFHQMNGLWNTVNLGLGTYGLISSTRKLKYSEPNFHLDHQKLLNTYKVNGYIDLGYMAIGSSMWLASNQFKNTNMADGYGKSLLLQGAFLFVFDWAMFRLLT